MANKYDPILGAYRQDDADGVGTPGGSDTQIQFNDGGAFGGFGAWDGSALTVPGKVGVGGTPTNHLHVFASDLSGATIERNANTSCLINITNTLSSWSFGTGSGATNGTSFRFRDNGQAKNRLMFNSAGGVGIGGDITNFVTFDGSHVIVEGSTGNMGIGTFPTSKLDVEGGAAIGASYAGTSAAPTNGLLVEGNVGIGEPSPAIGKLQVRQSTDSVAGGITLVNSAFSKTARLWVDGTNSYLYSGTGQNPLILNDTGNVGIGEASPTSKLDVNGSFSLPTTSKATDYTLTASDYFCNVTAAATITLPTAVGISGRMYNVKRSTASAVTIATTGSETIDGSASYSLATQNDAVTLISDNANWFIL